MVGMVMGNQHPRQVHAVGLDRVEQIACCVGRVDHQAGPGLPVADQVREIAHLRRKPVTLGEVPPGEQLAKVQPVV